MTKSKPFSVKKSNEGNVQLPFTSTIPKEKQHKQLTLSPKEVVRREKLGKLTWVRRRRAQRRRATGQAYRAEFYKYIQGKYVYLRKVYNQRKRYQKEGLPPRYQEGGSEAGVIPRWWNSNNEFNLTLDEFEECWTAFERIVGLTYRDRGLGRKSSRKDKSRNDYGDLKFGRRDRAKPFQRGNIEIYIPVKKVERERLVALGYESPKGHFIVKDSGRPHMPYKPLSYIPVEDMAVENATRASRAIVDMDVDTPVPMDGGALVVDRERLIVFRW